MSRAAELLGLDREGLRAALAAGHPLRADALAGRVYRGVSLGLPAWVDRLAWKTFAKVFTRDAAGVRGWNVRVEQTGLDGPLVPRTRAARDGGREPVSFGHFRVVAAAGHPLPRGVAPPAGGRALLLDYGAGANPRLDPSRCVRDPLVALDPHGDELLLGWSYLELGPLRLGTPSFFTLAAEPDADPKAFWAPAGP